MSDVFAPPSLEQMRERLDRARSCHRGQVPECRAILLDLRSDIDTALADGSADPALLRLTVDTLRLMADTFKLTTHPADRPVHEHDVVDELYQIVEILPLLPDTEVERAATLQEIYRLRSSAWPYVYIGAPDCARPGGFSAEPLRRAIGLLDGVGERGEELLADCLCDLAERGGIGVSLHERLAAARRAEALMDGAATNRIGNADNAGAERRTRRDGLVGRARQVQGRLFEALGDRDGAIEILLREHARSPLSRADPPRLSRLLREAGRPAEALEVLAPSIWRPCGRAPSRPSTRSTSISGRGAGAPPPMTITLVPALRPICPRSNARPASSSSDAPGRPSTPSSSWWPTRICTSCPVPPWLCASGASSPGPAPPSATSAAPPSPKTPFAS